MKQIDHDPKEYKFDRIGKGVWVYIWAVIGILWAGSFYLGQIQFKSVALGIITGIVFIVFAMELTGNKIPESWRRK